MPSQTTTTSTTLHLTSITLPVALNHDAWSRPNKPQPVSVSLALTLGRVPDACETDELEGTFSYSTLHKGVYNLLSTAGKDGNGGGGGGITLEGLVRGIREVALRDKWPVETLDVEVGAPKAVLRADGGLVVRKSFVKERDEGEFEYEISGLRCACVVGVNQHERLGRQSVVLDLGVRATGSVPEVWQPVGAEGGKEGFWQGMTRRVVEVVEESEFLTVEKLAAVVGQVVCAEAGGVVREVKVRVNKTEAYALAESVGCEVVVENLEAIE